MAFPLIVPTLKVYIGDTFSASYVLKEGSPAEAIDLDADSWTNWTAKFRTYPTATASVSFTVDTSDAANGRIVVSLTATQTAAMTKNGYWDLQSTRGSEVKTWIRGKVLVMKDVTRAS